MGDRIDERNRREQIARSIVKWQNVVYVPAGGQEGQPGGAQAAEGGAQEEQDGEDPQE